MPTDCSELAASLAELCYAVAQHPDVQNFDDVVAKIQGLEPQLTRETLIRSVEAHERFQREKRTKTARSKEAKITQEAMTEAGLMTRKEDLQAAAASGVSAPKTRREQRKYSQTIGSLRADVAKLEKGDRIRADLDEIREMLETGNIEIPTPKVKQLDKDIQDLTIQRDLARKQLRMEIESMRPKGFYDKFVASPFRAMGSLITSGEFSGFFNQGGFVFFSHPIIAVRNIPPGLSAFWSEKNEMALERELSKRKLFSFAEYCDLFFARSDGAVTKREEYGLSRIIEKIPFLAGTTRWHRQFLNHLRMDMFEFLIEGFGGGQATLEQGRAVARLVNAMTGRGSLGKFEPVGRYFADFAFAPRFYVSRLQMLFGQPLWADWKTTSPQFKLMVAKQYARYALGFAAMAVAMSIFGDADEEWDPRSTDFSRFKWGDTRIDFSSGFRQWLVFISRLMTGQTKKQGGQIVALRKHLVPLEGAAKPFSGQDIGDITSRFFRSKASPMLSAVTDVLTGEDFLGEPITVGSELKRWAGPITWRDIYTVMTSDEFGVPPKTAISLLMGFGGMGQTYKQERKRKRGTSSYLQSYTSGG